MGSPDVEDSDESECRPCRLRTTLPLDNWHCSIGLYGKTPRTVRGGATHGARAGPCPTWLQPSSMEPSLLREGGARGGWGSATPRARLAYRQLITRQSSDFYISFSFVIVATGTMPSGPQAAWLEPSGSGTGGGWEDPPGCLPGWPGPHRHAKPVPEEPSTPTPSQKLCDGVASGVTTRETPGKNLSLRARNTPLCRPLRDGNSEQQRLH